MLRYVLAFCLTAGSAAASGTPIAEVICAPSEQMTNKLTRQFGETQMGRGLRGPGQIMELWTDRHGDWTLVVRYAAGHACIVAMGEHWAGSEEPPQS